MKVSQPNPIVDFITSGGSGQLTFIVPVFQRTYSWQKENCLKLFNDVINGIPDENCNIKKEHYFGNIVYDGSEHDPFTNYTKYVLIDGQQRITSTMLLLAAIRDEEKNETAKKCLESTYLKNSNTPEELKLKLRTEVDREAYFKIVNNDLTNINEDSLIYTNYLYFRELVHKAKKTYSSEKLILGLRSLQVILIDLESRLPGAESPQVIFESLNATGIPLTDTDLLRNFLIYHISPDKQELYYKEYWLKVEQNIPNERMPDFLRRYLIMRLGKEVKLEVEYKTFTENYENLFENGLEALKELRKYSEYYKWLKNPETLPLKLQKTASLLREANLLKLTSATPLFLYLLNELENDPAEINATIRIILDWSFRARISNIIDSGEIVNLLTSGILDIIKAKTSKERLSQYLKFELSNFRARDIYASDKDFEEAFSRFNFYKNYTRYVQEKLAESFSNDTHLVLETVEHILPKSFDPKKWPDISEVNHAKFVDRIGNLVPMNKKDNVSNANSGLDKKEVNLEKSDWLITREAGKYKIDGKWTTESIENRSRDLAKKAVEIWSGPIKRTRPLEE
ncbi:DUF262 domain-containing protein [Candidatus Saccharibacteria bacterium]|nr:DUF262 domain-containing protein [Candidatus Saccharibacteria bacterium]